MRVILYFLGPSAYRYTWLAENMSKDEQKARVAKGLADFIAASGAD